MRYLFGIRTNLEWVWKWTIQVDTTLRSEGINCNIWTMHGAISDDCWLVYIWLVSNTIMLQLHGTHRFTSHKNNGVMLSIRKPPSKMMNEYFRINDSSTCVSLGRLSTILDCHRHQAMKPPSHDRRSWPKWSWIDRWSALAALLLKLSTIWQRSVEWMLMLSTVVLPRNCTVSVDR